MSHRALLWRAVNAEILDAVQRGVASRRGVRIVIDGARGVGKSAACIQLLQALVRPSPERPVVLYVGALARLTGGYFPYEKSSRSLGMYDQPKVAAQLLQMMASLNASAPFSKEIERVLADASGDAVGLLGSIFQGLASLDVGGGAPAVVVIVDELDALYAPTGYNDVDGRALAVEGLTVARMLKDLIEGPAGRGGNVSVVGATCRSNPALVDTTLDAANGAQLGYKWIDMPLMERGEVQRILEYYREIGHLFVDAVAPSFAEKVRFVSGGNAGKILAAVNYDAIYKK